MASERMSVPPSSLPRSIAVPGASPDDKETISMSPNWPAIVARRDAPSSSSPRLAASRTPSEPMGDTPVPSKISPHSMAPVENDLTPNFFKARQR
eukprot:m51a1_g2206 hypothetical protein (95) ;mRNA; r:175805-176326